MPRLLAATLVFVLSAPALAQSTPSNGEAVLQRMHDAYAGRWYSTLTFRQKTTQWRGGEPRVSQWYESLLYAEPRGAQLRIDTGEPSAGNGVLYTADSTYVIRGAKLAASQAGGNEFLPLIEGVYVQPVARTLRELAGTHVDFSRVARGTWEGRPAWIIGVVQATDSTVPQIWVDTARKVVVRMLMQPAPNAPVLDIHLGKYEPLGGGWLATKVEMYAGGEPRQFEEYSDWRADVPLSPELFDAATWSTAPHWTKP
ncbi:MAG TPA: hypothetical protein VHB25_04240 [Gemmatimonadaceae bacterium]|nr:hypothetical protein [Gemmatimonadaceae bacterium]